MTNLPVGVLLAQALFCTATVLADFQIRDGDRVVFLGDSITEQRLYTTYIEAYALTRYPEWKLTFRNVGWGGDTAWLRQRAHPDEEKLFRSEGEALGGQVTDAVGRGLGRDVLPLRPTFVTVKFGMNDHSYQKFRPDIFRAYARSQEEIGTVLAKNGARVAFLTPQPIEERRPDPDKDERNGSLRRFSDGLKEVAGRTGARYVDQFDPYMKILLAAREANSKAFVGGGDAIHPGPAGQTLMAWAVLKGLGAEAEVSVAVVDAGTGKAKTTGCTLEDLQVGAEGLSFRRTDRALPFPIDPRGEAALQHAPVVEDLSRLVLQVNGLSEGSYAVSIDGEKVATVTAGQLGAGWNYSQVSGPIQRQAREVLAGVFAKNDLFFNRWRNVQLYRLPHWAKEANIESFREAEMGVLDQRIAEAETKINGLRKPVVRRFEIRKTAGGS